MAYFVGNLDGVDPRVVTELRKLQEALNGPVRSLTFETLYAAPQRLYDGLVAKADGTAWNPGSGAGTYQYRGGAWQPWEGGGGGGGSSDHGALTGLADDDHPQYLNNSRGDARYSLLAHTHTGLINALRVSVDFGAGWSDKAQTVVTGQAWVALTSKLTAQIVTPTGTDPDEMYLLGMRAEISDLVAGVGFTVTVYTEAEASGTYTVMVLGN